MDDIKNQFKILSTNIDYQNPFMVIHKKEVQYPDGSVRPYWVMDRRGDFAVSIPIFPDNTTLLVGQYRVPTEVYSWEFPMGSVIGVSNPLAVAKQELEEETGFSAKDWKHIGEYYLANGHTNQKANVFIAKDLQEGVAHPEQDEFLKLKRVLISDVKKMIGDGTIKDGPTITAFFFLQNYI